MREGPLILVPVILCVQAVLVLWVAGAERPPAPQDLVGLPSVFDSWQQLREDPVAPEVLDVLRADRFLNRTYIQARTHSPASLFVAWFASQRAGARQPHSPKVCLPGSGWIPEDSGEVTLNTEAGPITVTRHGVVNHGQRAVVLYWYQTPRRVLAGEWAAKFWLVIDALHDRRTDAALVRIFTPAVDGDFSAATVSAGDFARRVYPRLRACLPR